ncbi:MAG: hypothetical protein ACKOXZ_01550, partial [Polynucleobacter victoriensis]
KNELVIKKRIDSSAGSHIKKKSKAQTTLTIMNGRKLSHSILGCIKPTIDKPRDRSTESLEI